MREHEYILTPGRYVGIEEAEDDGEPFDEKMTRLTSELAEMFAKSHHLEDEIREVLKMNNAYVFEAQIVVSNGEKME